MSIPLEDTFSDVISKSQRGQKYTDRALFLRAAIGPYEDTLRALKAGEFHHTALLKLGPALKLDAKRLIALARNEYAPQPVELDGLAQFNTPYDDYRVNAYIVWDPASKQAAAFDTGADATAMLDFIKSKGLTLTHIFITHTHVDHVCSLDALKAAGNPVVLSNAREPLDGTTTYEIGSAKWSVGALSIEPRLTRGHSEGGTTYVVTGLARPVAVVGDAIFAGSMGGAPTAYFEAIDAVRAQILSLPDNTVICPGHGPLTTVGEEKANNPFFP